MLFQRLKGKSCCADLRDIVKCCGLPTTESETSFSFLFPYNADLFKKLKIF